MDAQQLVLPTTDGGELAVTRWPGTGPTVVLLHAAVVDRRSWDGVAAALAADDLDLVAPDARGHGDSPYGPSRRFSPLDDLLAVLDGLDVDRAVLVGASVGGAVVLDLAVRQPDRVAGVVLLAPGVTGQSDADTPFAWEADPATTALLGRAGGHLVTDRDRVRALTHLWLDGPHAPERRVRGPVRDLTAAAMLGVVRNEQPEPSEPSGAVAWKRLGEVAAPTITAWGGLDLPCDLPFYEETARRIGQGPGRVLPGVAHLIGLERPDVVAGFVREVVAASRQPAVG